MVCGILLSKRAALSHSEMIVMHFSINSRLLAANYPKRHVGNGKHKIVKLLLIGGVNEDAQASEIILGDNHIPNL